MTAQDAIYFVPSLMGTWWWLLCAFFAFPAAVFTFLYMVMNHPFNGLWIARVVICIALACIGLSPLNAGLVPWGALLFSIGGLYTSFLIATDWCEREDKWSVLRDIWYINRRQEMHDTKGSAGHRRSGSRASE